jgi:hypothetical protein
LERNARPFLPSTVVLDPDGANDLVISTTPCKEPTQFGFNTVYQVQQRCRSQK